MAQPDATEVRLRIVEGLLRQASMADITDPQRIIDKASQLEKYVLASELKPKSGRGKARSGSRA